MLVTKLVSELFSVDSSRSDRRRICRLLCGLGHDREAGVLYLKRASEEIASHHRLVKPCGDIPSLIEGLSELFFECLQDTVVNYQSLFAGDGNHASFGICLSWLTKEIDSFIHKILLMVGVVGRADAQALGDEQEVVMSADGFSSFTSCITPLLHGASIVGEGARSDA